MDFLNKTTAQVTDLFKSMTPGARITAGLLLALVVISLGYLLNHATSGQQTFLMGGESFTAAQLNLMEAAFAKAGLHDARTEGNRIRVPLGKQSVYMGALADSGALPATFGKYLEKAVATSPWASKDQRRESIKIAKQNELQLIISHMQGIESAAVMYDVEEAKSFGKQAVTTASVSVQPQGGVELDENKVRMLRHLVAGAIAGLKPETVTVTDLSGRTYPGGTANGLANSMEDPYAGRKKMYEKEWADKIASALAYIPGVLVTSNVELEVETAHEETHTDFDPKTVPFNQREAETSKTTRLPTSGGRPGLPAQHGVNQPATVGTAGTGPDNTEENNQVETQSAVSNKVMHFTQTGLTPKRVTVQVSVPSSYYEKIWNERNPTPAGQELKKPDINGLADIKSEVRTDVQNAVNVLLPAVSATVDPFPRVTVTTFQHLPGVALPMPTLPDKALAWAGQYWSTLGMIAVALAGLVVLRSMVRASPAPSNPPAQFNVVQSTEEFNDENTTSSREPEPQNVRSRLKRRAPGGPSLREELSELVKEDPDAAVSVLRAWIGNAS